MKREELIIGMAALELFIGREISKPERDLWENALRDLDGAAFGIAVRRYIAESQYRNLPAPGLLRRYADEATHGTSLSAEQACRLIRGAVRAHGYGDTGWRGRIAEIVGPDVSEAIEAVGGIERFCDCESDGRSALTAQFRDAWNDLNRRQEQIRRLPADLRPQPSAAVRAIPGYADLMRLTDATGGDE